MKTVADVLTKKNWRKLPDEARGQICLGLAINYIYEGTPEYLDKYRLVQDAIRVLFPDRPNEVVAFNDHPDTTFDDILRVCKVAGV